MGKSSKGTKKTPPPKKKDHRLIGILGVAAAPIVPAEHQSFISPLPSASSSSAASSMTSNNNSTRNPAILSVRAIIYDAEEATMTSNKNSTRNTAILYDMDIFCAMISDAEVIAIINAGGRDGNDAATLKMAVTIVLSSQSTIRFIGDLCNRFDEAMHQQNAQFATHYIDLFTPLGQRAGKEGSAERIFNLFAFLKTLRKRGKSLGLHMPPTHGGLS